MKRTIPILTFVILFVSISFAQTPTPTPDEDDDIVKISTNLIQVDVSVTDKSGKVVKGLKAEDFEIFENGKKQEITNFSFVSAERTQVRRENLAKDKNTIPLPPQKIKPEQVRRTIALVVDDLTLSFESVHFIRRALKKFVDEQMQEGDLVAIIRTGGGIGALQQFTSDKRMLYAAIEKVRWKVYSSGGATPFAAIEATPLEKARASGSTDISDESIQAEKDLINRNNEFRENIFAEGTLGAINYIVRGMRDLPGRKSIMLMSDGFEIFSRNQSGNVLDKIRRLVDLANRSAVVVYTMDARGVQGVGFTAADNPNGLYNQDNGGVSTVRAQEDLKDRRDKLFNTQAGLVYLAKETGGFPILNYNDLSLGIRKVLDDQSYYLIGYQPDDETFDPNKRRFNKIEIKVRRDNTNVRYRSGFFGVDDRQIKKKPASLTPYQQITDALASPFAVNEINLSLNTVFKGDTKNNSIIGSFLYISIKDLKFVDEPDGMKKAVFDLLAMSFGDNGVPIDQISKTYTIRIKGENYQKLLKEGFIYYFAFPIKKAGAYQMRVAIRDHETKKVGSASQFIEVPKLNKKRLTLSGAIVENLSRDLWERGGTASLAKVNEKIPDMQADTALLTFKRGTVLRYGFEIYNANIEKGQTPQLEMRTRVFRDGELIFEGKPKPIDLTGQTNMKVIKAGGAMSIGTDMEIGEYVLQIIVTDTLAKKKKYKTATQFVQFEVVD